VRFAFTAKTILMQLRKTTSVPNPDWEPAQNNSETNEKMMKTRNRSRDGYNSYEFK